MGKRVNTSELTDDSISLPYRSTNTCLKLDNSGKSGNLAAAYIRLPISSMISSGHSLSIKSNEASIMGWKLIQDSLTEFLDQIIAKYAIHFNNQCINLFEDQSIRKKKEICGYVI
ncbi:hypothetical protein Cni_G00522 [Canna indica]|uniref:Uncharacterized protein n=1 Tax=Canna indica TaxID=4628 RepID=A0AAQ3JLE8_9LILI|nr:hypothetical protein Cni_G00522 [Canna indica]